MSKKNKEWFEKAEFWEQFGPIMFDEARWKEASSVAEYIKNMASLTDGKSVLDAGCGLGRISVELALLNLEVTGVDIIDSELEAAKESARDEGVEINFLKRDLRELDIHGQFDLAVNVYNSFGYCDSKEDDIKILKCIYESLKPDGKFVLECISRETAILYFTEGEWFERAGYTVLTDFKVSGLWEGLVNNWTLIAKNGKRIQHEYVQRLYSAAELKEILLKIGYRKVNVYGDYDFSPYDQHARTMVILAER